MRTKLIAALAAPLLLCAAAASAADLPRRNKAPDYFAPPPATFTQWQGFYAGVFGGYGWGAFNNGDYNFIGNPRGLLGAPSGGIVGFTGGYNHVIQQNFVLGLEADFGFMGTRSSQMPFFGVATESNVNYGLTLRGRAGYALDRALLYVTGGYAGARTSIDMANYYAAFRGTQSTWQSGWALGAGLEFMLTNNLSAKGEYLFTSVGSDRYFDYSPAALQAGVNTSTIKGGLNYHF